MPFPKTRAGNAKIPTSEHYFTGEMRTMPPQTAVILWILIILALIVPAVAGMRLLPPPW
jgi:hypothetical protein